MGVHGFNTQFIQSRKTEPYCLPQADKAKKDEPNRSVLFCFIKSVYRIMRYAV